MPVIDVINAGFGSFAVAITIESIPFALVGGGSGWTGLPAGLTEVRCLRIKNLKIGSKTNPKRLDFDQPSITFQLVDVADEVSSPKSTHKITSILAGIGGVPYTHLTTTLDVAEVGSMFVEDTSVIDTPGYAWVNQECIHIVDTLSGTEFGTLTRAQFGSIAQTHEVIPDDGEAFAEGFLIPRVKSAPTSWHGRRVHLWLAEVLPNGTLDTAEEYWVGQAIGDLSCEGAEWALEVESLVNSLRREIPTQMPTSSLRGITTDVADFVHWQTADTSGDVIVNANSWETFADFLSTIQGQYFAGGGGLRGAMFDAGDERQLNIFVLDGRIYGNVSNEGGAGAIDIGVTLTFGEVLGGILDMKGPVTIAAEVGLFENSRQMLGPEVVSAIAVKRNIPITIPVQNSSRFRVFSTLAEDGSAFSCVVINGAWFHLSAKNDGTNELTGSYLHSPTVNNPELRDVNWLGLDAGFFTAIRQTVDSPPAYVKQGVYVSGQLFACWRELFIENADIPAAWKRGLRTTDFDWDFLEAQLVGGPGERRTRGFSEGKPFSDMFIEDLRWAMMAPIVRRGKIAAVKIRPPTSLESSFSFTKNTKSKDKVPGFRAGSQRVVNRVLYKLRGIGQEIESEVNERGSQVEAETTNTLTLECGGVVYATKEELDELAAQAYSFMELFAWDNPEITEYGRIKAANVQPGDVLLVSDERLPNPLTRARVVSNAVMICFGAFIMPFKDHVHVELSFVWVVDGKRRSGYAPAARILSFTDNGAGAGDQRYELEIDDGFYAPVGVNEATFFPAAALVELRERDSTSGLTESRVVSAAGNDGVSVYLTAAPSAGMQAAITAGRGLLVLDDYSLSQVAALLEYVHLCDEDDGKILDGDQGFNPV